MKVAIATDGRMVAPHFGRCPEYTTFTVDDRGQVANRLVLPNPGHEPGFLPRYLAEAGIDVIIAGGMGGRAQGLFAEQGIQTVVGVSCPVEEAIRAFAAGELTGGESLCEHGPGVHGGDHCESHGTGRGHRSGCGDG